MRFVTGTDPSTSCDSSLQRSAIADPSQPSQYPQHARHPVGRCCSRSVPADLDAFISRTVADQHAIGVTVGVMQDGKVIFNKGYGLANTSRNTPVTTRHALRGRLGHQAIHVRGRAAAGAGRQAVVRRSRVALSRRLRPRQRHHAARSRQSRLRLSRLLSARLRRSADGEARLPKTDLFEDVHPQAARFPARHALLVQQHRLSPARSGRVARQPQAVCIRLLQERILTPLGMTLTRFEPTRGGPGTRRGLHAVRPRTRPKSSIPEGAAGSAPPAASGRRRKI